MLFLYNQGINRCPNFRIFNVGSPPITSFRFLCHLLYIAVCSLRLMLISHLSVTEHYRCLLYIRISSIKTNKDYQQCQWPVYMILMLTQKMQLFKTDLPHCCWCYNIKKIQIVYTSGQSGSLFYTTPLKPVLKGVSQCSRA